MVRWGRSDDGSSNRSSGSSRSSGGGGGTVVLMMLMLVAVVVVVSLHNKKRECSKCKRNEILSKDDKSRLFPPLLWFVVTHITTLQGDTKT